MSWLHDKTESTNARAAEAKRRKVFPFFREMENIGHRVKVGSSSYINFASNDYLGLSQHPKLIENAVAGTRAFGTGLGSARPQATSIRHVELERRLARWTGYDSCATFTTGYQAMVGTLQSFLDDDVTVVVDKLSHACIMDGLLLAQGQHPDMEMRFFKHNGLDSLRKALDGAANEKKLIVFEGLYSVDGDMAPVAKYVEIAREYGACLLMDDAHGLGALGRTGRGVAELNGVLGDVDIIVGTFSKSFGTVGGFVVGDQPLIDYLKLTARSFVFSATLPNAQVEAALTALDFIEKDDSLFRKLAENGDWFRAGLKDLGLDTGESNTHITPIFLNDELNTLKFGAYLYHGAGVIMMPFIAPGVPKGTERLRCNVTAVHTRSEMGYTLEALAQIGKMLRILRPDAKTKANWAQRSLWLAEHQVRGIRQAGLGFALEQVKKAFAKPE